jgi:hypothetical protein
MTNRLPILILLTGAILRIAGTGASALWFDESSTLLQSTIPLRDLLTVRLDNSGDLLLELLLRPLLAISHSLWMLRLPSMLAGLISLWLVWKLMQRLDFTPNQQIAAASVAAFLPGLIWIAQDARSYGVLSCLFLAALWFALEGRWLGLLAVCGLTVYAHNTGPVLAIAALLIATYLYPWKIRPLLLVALGTALAWIPAIIEMTSRWIIQQPWQPQLTFSWLLNSTIRAIWPVPWTEWFYLLACIILFRAALFLLSIKAFKARGRIVPLLAWLLPYLGLIAFSLITSNNMVLYRVLMPMLFPFALWLGWEIGRARPITWVAWALVLLIGLWLWNPSDRGGRLDLVAEQIRSQWRTGDALVYTSATVAQPFNYYLSDLPYTWDATITHPFLATSPMANTGTLAYTPLRSWVIVPADGLVTPEERSILDDMVHHQPPLYTVTYIQAAPIQVYLVEQP